MNKKAVLFVLSCSWFVMVVSVVLCGVGLCGVGLCLEGFTRSLAKSHQELMTAVEQHAERELSWHRRFVWSLVMGPPTYVHSTMVLRDVYFSGLPFVGRVFLVAGYFDQVFQLLDYASYKGVEVQDVAIPSLVGAFGIVLVSAALVIAVACCYKLLVFRLVEEDQIRVNEKSPVTSYREETSYLTNKVKGFMWEGLCGLMDYLPRLSTKELINDLIEEYLLNLFGEEYSGMLMENIRAERAEVRLQDLVSLQRNERGHPGGGNKIISDDFPDESLDEDLTEGSRTPDDTDASPPRMKSSIQCHAFKENSVHKLVMEGVLKHAWHKESKTFKLEILLGKEPCTDIEVDKLMYRVVQSLHNVAYVRSEWENDRIRERLFECFQEEL